MRLRFRDIVLISSLLIPSIGQGQPSPTMPTVPSLVQERATAWFDKLSDAEKKKVDERYKAYVKRTEDFAKQMQEAVEGLDPNEPMYYAARQAAERQKAAGK